MHRGALDVTTIPAAVAGGHRATHVVATDRQVHSPARKRACRGTGGWKQQGGPGKAETGGERNAPGVAQPAGVSVVPGSIGTAPASGPSAGSVGSQIRRAQRGDVAHGQSGPVLADLRPGLARDPEQQPGIGAAAQAGRGHAADGGVAGQQFAVGDGRPGHGLQRLEGPLQPELVPLRGGRRGPVAPRHQALRGVDHVQALLQHVVQGHARDVSGARRRARPTPSTASSRRVRSVANAPGRRQTAGDPSVPVSRGRISVREPSGWRCSPPQLTKAAPLRSTRSPNRASQAAPTSVSASITVAQRPRADASPARQACGGPGRVLADDPDPLVGHGPGGGDGVVGGAVVDHHQLEVGEGLRQHPGHGAAHHVRTVADRDHHAESWTHDHIVGHGPRRTADPQRRRRRVIDRSSACRSAGTGLRSRP